MLDRFKEFIGIDDEYDDYDEDDEQMYYENEEDEDTLELSDDKESKYTSFYSNDYASDTYKDDSYQNDRSYEVPSFSTTSSDDDSYSFSSSLRRGDKGVNMTERTFSPANSMRISIQEPLNYDQDAPNVIDDILNKKVVVLNLEMVDSDLRKRIFDFVSGAVYALDGSVERVTKGIFLISPSGVEVDKQLADQIGEGNYNQL
ncbi:MAG: cell division protein SepF [Anaerococcus sp.]|nr:cell division protein SepF [Anaerococcus sp.]